MRSIKTSEEIARIKKACKIGEIGLKRAEESIEPGKTEREVTAEIEYEMRKEGSDGTPFKTIVASGKNSRFPHTQPGEKEIEEGESVVVDLGASWKSYNSDMTRTFLVSPTPEQKELFRIAKRAHEAGMEKVRAGIDAVEVDEAAREVFRKHDYEEFYLHGIGHGVGLDIHEPPTLSPSSEDELKENMVITIEPGIYFEETGGYRVEDMLIVKENGYELLTDY